MRLQVFLFVGTFQVYQHSPYRRLTNERHTSRSILRKLSNLDSAGLPYCLLRLCRSEPIATGRALSRKPPSICVSPAAEDLCEAGRDRIPSRDALRKYLDKQIKTPLRYLHDPNLESVCLLESDYGAATRSLQSESWASSISHRKRSPYFYFFAHFPHFPKPHRLLPFSP